jgi:hypothetical protein
VGAKGEELCAFLEHVFLMVIENQMNKASVSRYCPKCSNSCVTESKIKKIAQQKALLIAITRQQAQYS